MWNSRSPGVAGATCTLPANPGKGCRPAGRGAPKMKAGGKGDLFARIKIDVPKKLNKRGRELLEEFQKVAG